MIERKGTFQRRASRNTHEEPYIQEEQFHKISLLLFNFNLVETFMHEAMSHRPCTEAPDGQIVS